MFYVRPPLKGLPRVIDQTRGLVNYMEESCSKAVYNSQLRFVCIAGRYIQGARFFGNSNANSGSTVFLDIDKPPPEVAVLNDANMSTLMVTTLRVCFIGQGYKQVRDQADVWGDGVVPELAAHLEGALNITLDGVYHSPVGSDDASRPWYGSPVIVEQWMHHILNQ